MDGTYEQGEIRIIKNTIEKSDTVLEIGTGLGFVSTFCSKAVGASQVITFEANPSNLEISNLVFRKNNVFPLAHHAILSDKESVISFSVNKEKVLASKIGESSEGHTSIDVPSMKLNKVIRDFRPSYLIMDIEGAEYEIFKNNEFYTIRKIQFELHPVILGKEKCDFIFSVIQSQGYILDENHSKFPNYYFYKN